MWSFSGEKKTWVRDVPVEDIQRYCVEMKTFFEAKYPNVFEEIRSSGQISDALKGTVEKALKELNEAFQPSSGK